MFDKTIGRWYDFYGVDNNRFKIGARVFEVLEDEDDGYRSYLGSIERTDGDGIFFPHPLARVKITEFDEVTGEYHSPTRGYRLTDKSGHVWLEFGTADYDDYYPCFVFRYRPKDPNS
jgi:hypothetical protein